MAKFYYNDVLLPEIPQEPLAEYPYVVVYKDEGLDVKPAGYYVLYATSVFVNQNNLLFGEIVVMQDTVGEYLVYYISDAGETYDVYSNEDDMFPYIIPLVSELNNKLIWSNHIINKVDDKYGTTVLGTYMEASDPVPEGGGDTPSEPEEDQDYRIKGSTLRGFGDQARRLGETTAELSPQEMIDIFTAVVPGGGSGGGGTSIPSAQGVSF